MIVAVEGPSAVGKTTWCRAHASVRVEEYVSAGAEPDESDPDAQAEYWVSVNSGRRRQAQSLESRSGVAVCDSDPLKLHYSWCLARIGVAPWSRFELELRYVRAAFARGDLGLADLVLISIPDEATSARDETLTQVDNGDTSRCTAGSLSRCESGIEPSKSSSPTGWSGSSQPMECRILRTPNG